MTFLPLPRRPQRPPRRGRARGATLVEFIIVFPLASLFVLGLIQAGFLYIARMQLNHATFMAARAGSIHHADADVMRSTLVRGLNPFYERGGDSNDATRLGTAAVLAKVQAVLPGTLTLTTLNPSDAAFKDFGVKDPVSKVTYIPNDNLEWRSNGLGSSSKLNLRDANLLKLRAVYGYELKVPLMAGVLRRVMCGGSIGVAAWGNVSLLDAEMPGSTACLLYYSRGRIPLESVAIVEMQSRAERP